MIAVISPAKTLDFETTYDVEGSIPRFTKETERLVRTLRRKKEKDLQSMMSISEKIAQLNVERYKTFQGSTNPEIARPAIYAFKGDVYLGLEAETLNEDTILRAQDRLRILSGLYGVLKPLDLIEPYRLEMGTRLKVGKHDTLYDFWGNKIARQINADLEEQGTDILLNLASKEYFKSIPRKHIKGRIIDVEFKDFKNGQYKIISFFAKKARGLMSRYMLQHNITDTENLKGFDSDGYYFAEDVSKEDKLVFYRG